MGRMPSHVYVQPYKLICLFFSIQATEVLFEHCQTFMMGLFCKKKLTAKSGVNCFHKKGPPETFGGL